MGRTLHGEIIRVDDRVWSKEFGWGYIWAVASFGKHKITVRFNKVDDVEYKYDEHGIREGSIDRTLYRQQEKADVRKSA